MQDEVFSHRLGLLPLRADPRQFEWKPAEDDSLEGDEKNTLEFELKVRCSNRQNGPNSSGFTFVEKGVYAKDIRWLPRGDQKSWVNVDDPGPIDDEESHILLNKLHPGHELDIKLYAIKGIGRDHAKFSPVATAFYRLLPKVCSTWTVWDPF